MIGYSNYFGFGLTTLIWKPLLNSCGIFWTQIIKINLSPKYTTPAQIVEFPAVIPKVMGTIPVETFILKFSFFPSTIAQFTVSNWKDLI